MSDRRTCVITILTFVDDLHALVIQDRLRTFPDTECQVVEVDALADGERGLSWSNVESFPTIVATRDGGGLDVAGCDLIWFRRWSRPQRAALGLGDSASVELVNESTAATLLGALLGEFRGVWVNAPDATRRGENKLLQLRAAAAAGLKVPRTIVSQVPEDIRRLSASLGTDVVMKTVRATASNQLFTVKVAPEHLEDDDALRLCPTIFQEYVPGARHIRALCCGSAVHAAVLESDDLDWRRNLNVPIEPIELDPLVQEKLVRVLETMGLRMGVVDLKVDDAGVPVWLELNPQGQFLWVEGLTGLDLTQAFSEFLRGEATAAASPR